MGRDDKMKLKMPKKAISHPAQLADLMFEVYKNNTELESYREQLYLIGLNTRNVILFVELISMGTINETLISSREIFKTALIKNAVGIVIVHNHPSGDAAPSTADIESTKKIVSAGKLLEIAVLDHIIISGNQYASLKQLNML